MCHLLNSTNYFHCLHPAYKYFLYRSKENLDASIVSQWVLLQVFSQHCDVRWLCGSNITVSDCQNMQHVTNSKYTREVNKAEDINGDRHG